MNMDRNDVREMVLWCDAVGLLRRIAEDHGPAEFCPRIEARQIVKRATAIQWALQPRPGRPLKMDENPNLSYCQECGSPQGHNAYCSTTIEANNAELARLRAANAELVGALKDAAMICDSLERNKDALAKMARAAKWPDPWQVGHEPKIARIRAALAKAKVAP
jgi:hypothetical protein